MNYSDKDKRSVFDDQYDEAYSYWQPTQEEMYTDTAFYLGDQWTSAEKSYLAEQERAMFVYNYGQRIVHSASGRQRKNRLGFGVEPQNENDEARADYLQDALIWQANRMNIYNDISDAYEDACITGASLITIGMNYDYSQMQGSLCSDVESFQSYLLDPNFQKINLSDCRYGLRRKYLSKSEAKLLLPPDRAKYIDDLPVGQMDYKFDYMSFTRNRMNREDLIAYDEQYERDVELTTFLEHKASGERVEWKGSKEELKRFMNEFPFFYEVKGYKPVMKYRVYCQEQLMYEGEDPLGIGDYPCTPVLWVYRPQYDDYRYKLQGLMRPLRDPLRENNRKRSKLSDMLDSQATGWVTEDGAVVNENDLFKTGQGQVIKTRPGKLNALREKQSSDIPSGLVALLQMLDKDMIQITGMNEESLGIATGGNTEVSGVLAQQRAQNASLVLQGVDDNLSESQKIIGNKILKAMIANYSQAKWERITGKPLPEGLLDKGVVDYDIVVKQTQITDTQRMLRWYQYLEAKQVGINIPDSYGIEVMPTADKTKLKELYQKEAQQTQQVQQMQQQLEMMKLKSVIDNINADTTKKTTDSLANKGLAVERTFQAQKDYNQGFYDVIKGLKELESMDLDNAQKALQLYGAINAQAEAKVEEEQIKDSIETEKMEQDSPIPDQGIQQSQPQQGMEE